MEILFKDVFSNEETYQKAKFFWQNLITNSAFSATKTKFAEDEILDVPIMENDGNPICMMVFKPLGIAVRVIHHEKIEEGEYDLDFWVDDIAFIEECSGMKELVVSCCPSKENKEKVKTILHEWFSTKQCTLEV